MELEEGDKSAVRHFLSTNAAKHWLEFCEKSCPRLERSKVASEVYNDSLHYKEGWQDHSDFLKNSVSESKIPEYGVPYIDPVSD